MKGKYLVDLEIGLDTLGIIERLEKAEKAPRILGGGGNTNTGGGGTWGSITGTLSNQTDLQQALNTKYNASNPSGYISNLSGFDTGDLAEGSNLYFTNTRARTALTASGLLSYNNLTGDFSLSALDIDHGSLSGLSDDDHSQYILVDGTRGFTGVVDGQMPVGMNNLVTKGYIDNVISNIAYRTSVLERLDTPPGTPAVDDRYIVLPTATGAWTGQENSIAEWNGSSWDFETPSVGWATYVQVEGLAYVFNGTDWVIFGVGTTVHANLIGLNADDHPQYHTDARALTWLGTRSTTDLAEGTNLYFTNTRAVTALTGQNISLFNNDANYLTSLSFLGLTDTPSSYSGQANKVVSVKADGSGLEFTTPSSGSAGVTSLNSLTGALSIAGTTNRITVTPAGSTITLSTPQDIHTSATPQFLRMGIGTASLSSAQLLIGGTQSTAIQSLNISPTWNNAAGLFRGIYMAITNTASSASSTPFRLGTTTSYLQMLANGRLELVGPNLTTAYERLFNITGSWNQGGGALYGFVVSITDTLSGPASRIVDFSLNGDSKFYVQKDGLLFARRTNFAAGSMTAAYQSIAEYTGTWNTGGGELYGINMIVTDTISGASSKLVRLAVGSEIRWSVHKTGATEINTGAATPTGATNILNVVSNWNISSTSYTGVRIAITDTASSATSAYLRILQGATEVFKVGKNGTQQNSGQIVKRTAVSTTYTALVTDFIIDVTTTSAPITINLPAAAGNAGRMYIIKDISGQAATNNITVDANSTQLIDGTLTKVISGNFGSLTLVCTGSGWSII